MICIGNPGKGEDIIFDTRNGLWVHEKVEAAFDRGRIVIVPGDLTRRKIEGLAFKLRVLNPKMKTENGMKEQQPIVWAMLDRQEFGFKGATNPPVLRYLYIQHYLAVMNLARAKVREGGHKVTGTEINEIPSAIHRGWRRQTLRKSTRKGLARLTKPR